MLSTFMPSKHRFVHCENGEDETIFSGLMLSTFMPSKLPPMFPTNAMFTFTLSKVMVLKLPVVETEMSNSDTTVSMATTLMVVPDCF